MNSAIRVWKPANPHISAQASEARVPRRAPKLRLVASFATHHHPLQTTSTEHMSRCLCVCRSVYRAPSAQPRCASNPRVDGRGLAAHSTACGVAANRVRIPGSMHWTCMLHTLRTPWSVQPGTRGVSSHRFRVSAHPVRLTGPSEVTQTVHIRRVGGATPIVSIDAPGPRVQCLRDLGLEPWSGAST